MRLANFLQSACALLAVAAIPCVVRAEPVQPFRGTLESTTTSAVPTPEGFLYIESSVTGWGTVIGPFTGSARYVVNLADGSFTGVLTKVARNGDEVHEAFIGRFNADFTESIGEFWITEGTGRFDGAHGGGLFTGDVTSPATIDIQFVGAISR